MKINNLFIKAVVAMFIASGSNASVADVNEVEPNDTLATAQQLSMPTGEVTIHGVIGTLSAFTTSDLDFYSFYAKAGDVVTFDIDIGIGGAKPIHTVLAVFNPDGTIRGQTYMSNSIDPGSLNIQDPRLDNVKLTYTGVYTVAVSGYPRFFSADGIVLNPSSDTGDYELIISGVSPSMRQIDIEVKPGDNQTTTFNPKSHGKIPVALLSESDFDAMNVDESSLSFGATGDENSLYKCHRNGMDVNGDGLLDKVCIFDVQKAGFSATNLMGKVKGRLLPQFGAATTHGTAFEGTGYLKMVPAVSQ